MPVAPGEVHIHDGNWFEFIADQVVDGQHKARGLIPRDYQAHPVGYLPIAPPMHAVDMPLIPRSEWSERIKDMEATQSRLSDLWKAAGVRILDQNGKGYCWAHSTTSAVLAVRARDNQPYVPLSAYAVACVIKQYRDEGGWGAQSLEFISERGVPSEEFWPQQSMSRSNDKPETWANAALHKMTEGWIDLQAALYDRDLTYDQVITCLLCRCPVVGDFNWWGHSVCLLDPVETSPGKFGVRIANSWGASWSEGGMGVLSGQKAVPDGATALRAVLASAA